MQKIIELWDFVQMEVSKYINADAPGLYPFLMDHSNIFHVFVAVPSCCKTQILIVIRV